MLVADIQMKIIIAITVLVLVVFVCNSNTTGQKPRRPRKNQEEPTNNIIFEKHEYEIFDTDLVSWLYVDVRPVANNVLKVNITGILNKTVNELYVRVTLYKKYATYQKYLIDVRENVCDFFQFANRNNPVSKVIINNMVRILQTNFPLRCPFKPDRLVIWNDRLNVSELTFPLMPAGRYRMEVLLTEMSLANKYGLVKLYFAISDLRVWF